MAEEDKQQELIEEEARKNLLQEFKSTNHKEDASTKETVDIDGMAAGVVPITKRHSNKPLVAPTNVLLDYSTLQHAMKEFACPICVKKCSKKAIKHDNYRTLELSQFTNGFASEVTISCHKCKMDIAKVEPQHQHSELHGQGSTGSFLKYAVNYFAVMMMQ